MADLHKNLQPYVDRANAGPAAWELPLDILRAGPELEVPEIWGLPDEVDEVVDLLIPGPAGKLRVRVIKAPEPEDTTVWSVPVGGSPVRGKATALVTIVEFADYQCPFCVKVEATLAELLQSYGDKVRLVWKHDPLAMHKDAPLAHIASMAWPAASSGLPPRGSGERRWRSRWREFSRRGRFSRCLCHGYDTRTASLLT